VEVYIKTWAGPGILPSFVGGLVIRTQVLLISRQLLFFSEQKLGEHAIKPELPRQ